jgi:hypothetical protein
MPQQHQKAGKLHEAEEVLDEVLPARDQTAEIVHPGKQLPHFPAPAVAPQFASVLRLAARRRLGAIISMSYFSARHRELVMLAGGYLIRCAANLVLQARDVWLCWLVPVCVQQGVGNAEIELRRWKQVHRLCSDGKTADGLA